MKKNILVISFCVPYDNVGHAGGKTHNFYLKKINEEKDFEVSLISFGVESDRAKCDLDKYKISNHVFYIDNDILHKVKRGIMNLSTKYNPFDKRGNMLPKYYENKVTKELKKMKTAGKKVDIVILEWTQMVFLAGVVKKYFPDCKIIASEHDVSYLGFKRKYEYAKESSQKYKYLRYYNSVKKEELDSLNICDRVFPHNRKDQELLVNDGIRSEKIHPIVAYFDNYSQIKRTPDMNTIMFYGAMGRPENYLSAIWFIDNVMIQLKDKNIDFTIVGSNPSEELMKSAQAFNDKEYTAKVVVTGFVEDITPYLEKATCLCAPLVLGAGIKVKILEALSAGLVVLTNDIGIEGIDAINNRDYFHCETKEDYVKKINKIIDGKVDIEKISENARDFIGNNFNLEESASEYIEVLKQL